jgi:hypothetical protein
LKASLGGRRGIGVCVAIGSATAWVGCVALKGDDPAPGDHDAGVDVGAESALPDTWGGDAGAGPDATSDGGATHEGGADGSTDGSTDGSFDAPAEAPPPVALWSNDVPVCWASPADQAAFASTTDGQAHWIHDGVESNWAHEANLRFGSWPLCPTPGVAVMPKVEILPVDAGVGADAGDDGGTLAVLGEQVDGFGIDTGSSPSQPARIHFLPLGTDNDAREQTLCAVNRAFSRVLGLADDPAAQPVGASSCGDVSGMTGSRLSPLQILRLRKAYGAKPAGSIVSFDGRCLTASSTAAGSIVWTDDCVPQASGVAGPAQRWTFDPWAGSIALVEGGLALDSKGAAEGTPPVVNPTVAGSPDQVWSPSGSALRGIGGTCLDFQSTPSGGTRAVLWPCGRSVTTQRLTFGAGSSIQASGSMTDAGATCLAIQGGSQVGAASCDGSASQQWKLAAGGAVQSLGVNAQCLAAVIDPQNPEVGLESGVPLQVAACNGALEQRFDIFGNLLASSMCLDVAGLARADQAKVWAWGCTATNGLLGWENDWWDVTW